MHQQIKPGLLSLAFFHNFIVFFLSHKNVDAASVRNKCGNTCTWWALAHVSERNIVSKYRFIFVSTIFCVLAMYRTSSLIPHYFAFPLDIHNEGIIVSKKYEVNTTIIRSILFDACFVTPLSTLHSRSLIFGSVKWI